MSDLRLAIRSLRATPVVTAVAIVSLALGIGANTAIFSLVDRLVLKSLPVADPQRLYLVSAQRPDPLRRQEFSYATFKQLRRHPELFDATLGYGACCGKALIAAGGSRTIVDRQLVTGDFFSALGVPAFRGRLLTLADDGPGAPEGPVVVLGYGLWQRQFGGRDDIVGTPLTIDGVVMRVIGVTPPEFLGVEVGRAVEMFVPRYLFPRITSSPFDDDTPILTPVVRLRPGLTVAAATAELRAAQPQIRADSMPTRVPSATFLPEPFTLTSVAAGTSGLRTRFERPLFVIFAVVALVLLLACANVGSVLLARAIARRRDLSVRVAIGASRWQLARPFLIESALLSLAGAIAGLFVAAWTIRTVLMHVATVRDPIVLSGSVDWRVLLFTLTAMVVTAVLFGTLPAARASAVAPIEALRAHGNAPPVEATRLAHALIVLQVVLSLLLVTAAGLFVQTFERLAHVALGFDRDRAIIVSLRAATISAADRPIVFARLARELGRLPGVDAAGAALNPPIIGSLVGDLVVSAPGTQPPPDAARIPEFDSITPRWFAAYGINLERGRDFDERDTRESTPVAIVSAAFARQLYPGRDVIGMPIAITFRFPMGDYAFGIRTIVGVVSDSMHNSLRDRVRPMVFVPLAQREPIPQNDVHFAVRASSGSPELLERQVAAAITAFNPDMAFSFEAMSRVVDESLAQERVTAMLAALFGTLALLLAGLGVYGVTSHSVVQRRRELGIRLALGAAPAEIVRLVVWRSAWLVAVGVAIGGAAGLWASRFISSLLFGLTPRDPATFVAAAVALVAVAAIAAFVPGCRASRIDPAEVLRDS